MAATLLPGETPPLQRAVLLQNAAKQFPPGVFYVHAAASSCSLRENLNLLGLAF